MSSDKIYFVKNKGRIHGPFNLSQLKGGLAQAKLSRAHMVSTDRTNWTALGELLEQVEAAAGARAAAASQAAAAPETALATGAPATQPPPPAITLQPPVPGQQAPSSLTQVNGRLMAAGIAMTAALVLPVFVDPDSGPIWTWSVLGDMPGRLTATLVFSLLAGISFIVLSAATRGIARPIAVLGVVAVNALLFFSAIAFLAVYTDSNGSHGTLIISLVLLSMAVSALLQWRAPCGTLPRRIIACVFSSVLTLIGGILLVMAIIDLDFDLFDDLEAGTTIMLLAGMLMTFAGFGLSIAGGILGIVQIKSVQPSSQSRIGHMLVRTTPVLIFGAVGLMVAGAMLSEARPSDAGWVALNIPLLVIQFVVTPVAFVEAFREGLRELLTAISMSPATTSPAVAQQAAPPPPPAT